MWVWSAGDYKRQYEDKETDREKCNRRDGKFAPLVPVPCSGLSESKKSPHWCVGARAWGSRGIPRDCDAFAEKGIDLRSRHLHAHSNQLVELIRRKAEVGLALFEVARRAEPA